jgi:hypothetical protein
MIEWLHNLFCPQDGLLRPDNIIAILSLTTTSFYETLAWVRGILANVQEKFVWLKR